MLEPHDGVTPLYWAKPHDCLTRTQTCIHAYLYSSALAYLHNSILAYLLACLLAYMLTSVLAYLLTCLL